MAPTATAVSEPPAEVYTIVFDTSHSESNLVRDVDGHMEDKSGKEIASISAYLVEDRQLCNVGDLFPYSHSVMRCGQQEFDTETGAIADHLRTGMWAKQGDNDDLDTLPVLIVDDVEAESSEHRLRLLNRLLHKYSDEYGLVLYHAGDASGSREKWTQQARDK